MTKLGPEKKSGSSRNPDNRGSTVTRLQIVTVLKIQKLGIKVSNFYCEEIKKLRPGELGLHQSRMEGFWIVCVYIKGGGAMPMMEKW